MPPLVEFPIPEEIGKRQWGLELEVCASPENWVMKMIVMKKGAKGGLQYHRLKDEGGMMTMGKMLVRYDDGTGKLAERIVKTGDPFRFPPGSVHQTEAITACAYVECSTPHFNDRVHVEADYGIDEEAGGLPTTELADIEVR